MNTAARALFGCDASAIGQPVAPLILQGLPAGWATAPHPHNLQPEETILHRMGRCRRCDGTEFPAEFRMILAREASPSLLLLTVRSLVAEASSGDNAADSPWPNDERYRAIVAAMQEGIVMQGADGRILAANPSAERILGLTAEQLQGFTSIDPRWGAIHPDGSPFPGEEHPAMVTLRTGQPLFHVPMGIRHADGSIVWISVNSQPLSASGDSHPYAVISSFTDVTQALAAEQALRDQEQLLRAVVENMPIGVWIMDKAGNIVLGNVAGQRIWAGARYIGPEQFGEYKGWRYPSGEPIAADEWAAARAIRLGETSIDEVVEIECFDGTHKIIFNSALPVFDDDGQVAGGIIVNQDVTERVAQFRSAERQIAERTREIEALLHVGQEMASTLDLEPLLRTILTQLHILVEYDGAAIGIVSDGELQIAEYIGPVPRENMVGQRYRLDGRHPYGDIIREVRTIILADMWKNPYWLAYLASPVDENLVHQLQDTHSWLGTPLVAGGVAFGVLRIDHQQIGFFTQEHARIVSAFAAHAAVVIQNAQLYEQTQRAAALEERQRLARELHDSVSQALYGIALGVRTAQRLLERNPEDAKKPLQYTLELADAAFAEMRALIFELRPDSLESDGLIAALDRQIASLRARHHITVEADLCAEPDTSIGVKEAIYRIVQEAAQNAINHAHATRIDICLTLGIHNELLLEVVDDGNGFDLQTVPPGHYGLRNMRERAEALQGSFEIESAPGEGARITVRIPMHLGS